MRSDHRPVFWAGKLQQIRRPLRNATGNARRCGPGFRAVMCRPIGASAAGGPGQPVFEAPARQGGFAF
jgi:hypothetical protein